MMKKHSHITGFYVETLMMIVVFLLIILLLTQVFGLAQMQSTTAKRLNGAVVLAQNAADNTLMAFPEGSYIMNPNRPYVELSAGIHNIFKIIQIEYVHRCNYVSLPTAKRNGIRFMVRMTF